MVRTRWGADPLHRGSYSYVTARSSTSDVETLAGPLVGCLLLHAAIILVVLKRAHETESRCTQSFCKTACRLQSVLTVFDSYTDQLKVQYLKGNTEEVMSLYRR